MTHLKVAEITKLVVLTDGESFTPIQSESIVKLVNVFINGVCIRFFFLKREVKKPPSYCIGACFHTYNCDRSMLQHLACDKN